MIKAGLTWNGKKQKLVIIKYISFKQNIRFKIIQIYYSCRNARKNENRSNSNFWRQHDDDCQLDFD